MSAPFILIVGTWLFAFLRIPAPSGPVRDVFTECMLACVLGFTLTLIAAKMEGVAP